jgi:hypothetical protein
LAHPFSPLGDKKFAASRKKKQQTYGDPSHRDPNPLPRVQLSKKIRTPDISQNY